MPRALVLLNLCGREANQHMLKNRQKNVFFVFSGCFWAYVGQPHNHISCATPMLFTSINCTNLKTNPWNCHEKLLRIGRAGKLGFFESSILNFNSELWKFLHNLGKDFMQTDMHTRWCKWIKILVWNQTPIYRN